PFLRCPQTATQSTEYTEAEPARSPVFSSVWCVSERRRGNQRAVGLIDVKDIGLIKSLLVVELKVGLGAELVRRSSREYRRIAGGFDWQAGRACQCVAVAS